MSSIRPRSLRAALTGADASARMLARDVAPTSLFDLAGGESLGGRLGELSGARVLLATDGQLPAAMALVDLDGVARRIVLAPPDLKAGDLPSIARNAEIDAIVSDRDPATFASLDIPRIVPCGLPIEPLRSSVAQNLRTEWVLMTSGTTGVPKMVAHDLDGLTAAIAPSPIKSPGVPPVWATFYDIRRYGGLQIFLRAMLGRASLVLSDAGEPIAAHLARLGSAGVTHISGTPSHWRRVLMSPAAHAIAPAYVRLSGEIADQAVLDHLREAYPKAAIGHAYASTEAGVGFDVNDGREGFPADLVGRSDGDVRMIVAGGSLRIRSNRAASAYVGPAGTALVDAEGFVDTGDMVERRGDRYYFAGRRGGIINVGGLKVHPEEIEAVINRHHAVEMSLVKARRSPITGAIVVADVVLTAAAGAAESVKSEIFQACRSALPAHKVPAAIRFVAALDVTAAGKLARPHG